MKKAKICKNYLFGKYFYALSICQNLTYKTLNIYFPNLPLDLGVKNIKKNY